MTGSNEDLRFSLNRRNFLRLGGASAALTASGIDIEAIAQADGKAQAGAGSQWRNKQPGMAYRRLGRTGMMISEVICGGDPIKLENYEHLNLALEMGLNYLDMAPSYNQGKCEEAYGRLLTGSSAKRDKVYLTTKISSFNRLVGQMYKEVFDGLPQEKKDAIIKRAGEMREQREVEKPGYFLTYFPGQQNGFNLAYLRAAMLRDYRHKVEGSGPCRKFISESLEASLKRVGTDYFDIVMCPHGANSPEDLQCPEIVETFQQFKQQGKVRFLGVTSHNDPAGVLRAAAEAGYYDVAMFAYNVINGGYLEETIRYAASKGMGLIAMKAAHAVATHHQSLQPIPEWRVQKINRIIPGEMKAPVKAYLWVLQNPNISAVISNLWDENYVKENLSIAGKKVELQPA
jgi:aryl-alcohol dehydrogenase-like predicted oxidoreductase